MDRDRKEQIRKLGKAAERFRMAAKFKIGTRLFADGMIVTEGSGANLFLVAEGLSLAGSDGVLLLDELARVREALAELVGCADDAEWGDRPAVRIARELLEGTHEHVAIARQFAPPASTPESPGAGLYSQDFSREARNAVNDALDAEDHASAEGGA